MMNPSREQYSAIRINSAAGPDDGGWHGEPAQLLLCFHHPEIASTLRDSVPRGEAVHRGLRGHRRQQIQGDQQPGAPLHTGQDRAARARAGGQCPALPGRPGDGRPDPASSRHCPVSCRSAASAAGGARELRSPCLARSRRWLTQQHGGINDRIERAAVIQRGRPADAPSLPVECPLHEGSNSRSRPRLCDISAQSRFQG
jgi:hypothetical protein